MSMRIYSRIHGFDAPLCEQIRIDRNGDSKYNAHWFREIDVIGQSSASVGISFIMRGFTE